MELRLKLLFRGRQSALALKAVLFAGFLTLVKAAGFGLAPVAFFLIISFLLYNAPPVNSSTYFISFAILSLLALFLGARLNGAAYFIDTALAAFLFYILLGLKNMFFVYRERWHYFFLLAFFYGIAIWFFSGDQASPPSLLFKILLTLFLAFFISRDFFRVSVLSAVSSGTAKAYGAAPLSSSLIAAVCALAAYELFWAVSLLPIGFMNSVNLSLIAFFGLTELMRRHFLGLLGRGSILASITIFTILALVIFAFSNWRL